MEASADTSLVAACPDARSSRLDSAFRIPVLMYIGRISCGDYLLHAVIFGVLRKSAVAIAVASAAYYLFEQSILSHKRYFATVGQIPRRRGFYLP